MSVNDLTVPNQINVHGKYINLSATKINLGKDLVTNQTECVNVGFNNTVNGPSSIAIGNEVTTTVSGDICLGQGAGGGGAGVGVGRVQISNCDATLPSVAAIDTSVPFVYNGVLLYLKASAAVP